MTAPTNPSELFSPFLPSTYNIPEEDDRLDTFLVDNLSIFSDVINDKTIGTFVQSAQNFNGEKWYYANPRVTRNGYQVIVHFPSLPNATTVVLDSDSTPPYPILDVQPEFVITDLYGTASLPPTSTGAGDGDFIKYNNRGDPRIFFDMSDTQITITTTVDLSSYSGFIIIKYLRNGL